MIELNLLPEIKQKYLQSQKIKRVFLLGSFIVSAAFIALVVLMALFVFVAQKVHLSSVQSDIDDNVTKINQIQDIDKVVTIQKQLDSLPTLHQDKTAIKRVLDLLNKLVPNSVSLNSVQLQAGDIKSIEFSGTGEDIKAVNTFADTLKFSTLKTTSDTSDQSQAQGLSAFPDVKVISISPDDEGVTFTIEATFDVLLTSNVSEVTLTVPKITSSAPVTERPRALFEPSDTETEGDN